MRRGGQDDDDPGVPVPAAGEVHEPDCGLDLLHERPVDGRQDAPAADLGHRGPRAVPRDDPAFVQGGGRHRAGVRHDRQGLAPGTQRLAQDDPRQRPRRCR